MDKENIKLKFCEFTEILKKILSSKYFPFLTAVLSLVSHYIGWDIVLYYYFAITGILMIFLLDDLTPIISSLIFIGVSISLKNTPTRQISNPDYYSTPAIYIQIVIVAGLLISAAVYRLIKTIKDKKFKLTPMFFGMCGFAFILLINGVFSYDYNFINLLFGFILAIIIIGIYSALKDNIKLDSEGFERIAYGFFALSLILVIELIVAYATIDNLFVDGNINRWNLYFGWGDYNTYGLRLVMCLPAIIYLAGRKNLGFVYTLYSFVLFVAVFFSCSRQTMVGGVIIYLLCVTTLFIKGKNRVANMCVLSVAAVAVIILVGIYHKSVFNFFKIIFDNFIVNGELDGSGRMRIWREAIGYFKENPFFGSGFFVDFSYEDRSTFIPKMCHNTVLQLLGSCGIIGLAVYTMHRTQTVLSFFKNVTVERVFIVATILSILILSLLDHHLFNIFPTIIYSALIAVLEKSEERTKSVKYA